MNDFNSRNNNEIRLGCFKIFEMTPKKPYFGNLQEEDNYGSDDFGLTKDEIRKIPSSILKIVRDDPEMIQYLKLSKEREFPLRIDTICFSHMWRVIGIDNMHPYFNPFLKRVQMRIFDIPLDNCERIERIRQKRHSDHILRMAIEDTERRKRNREQNIIDPFTRIETQSMIIIAQRNVRKKLK